MMIYNVNGTIRNELYGMYRIAKNSLFFLHPFVSMPVYIMFHYIGILQKYLDVIELVMKMVIVSNSDHFQGTTGKRKCDVEASHNDQITYLNNIESPVVCSWDAF